MAWTRTSWTDIIGTDGSKQSIAFGASYTSSDIDCNGSNILVAIGIKVVILFGASPDDDVTVELLGKDADDANEQDTLAMFEASIPEATSSEERATYQVSTLGLDTLNVKLTNNDSADAITAWVEYIGLYWS